MKNIFTLLAAVLLTATTFAQVGIGTSTPHASAALDLTSTTGGLLLPRMTNAERLNISEPAAGLQVFVTDFDGGRFMFYDGTEWGTISFTEKRPDAPTIGTATLGNAQATVSFTASSSNGGSAITSYTATSSPGDITATVTQSGSGNITVTGLTNGTAYTFTVTATNAIGTSAVSAASNLVVPTTVPDAPTIETAVAGNQQATVSFTAPSSDGGSAITSYTATSSPGDITGTISQSGSGSITVTGLTNGTAYTYTVTATNAIGTSVASTASNLVTSSYFYGRAYLFQHNDVYSLDLASGSSYLVAENVTVGNINAVGYNPTDGYIWGSLSSPSKSIVRIDENFNSLVYYINELPSQSRYVGDVSPDGIYYLKSGDTTYYMIDLNPNSPTYTSLISSKILSQNINIHDWAFNAVDGHLYTVERQTNHLYRINTNTSELIDLGEVPILAGLSYIYGAVYFDASGRFYVSANQTGTIYVIQNVQTLEPGSDLDSNICAYGPSSQSNDGARSPTAPVPQEDCANGVDDDGDGLVDCDDPACSGTAGCPSN